MDDFGQGASNLERVWLLEPDYVKLDKVLMRRALMRPALRDKLTELVAILKLHGAKVVGEGIESEMQLTSPVPPVATSSRVFTWRGRRTA